MQTLSPDDQNGTVYTLPPTFAFVGSYPASATASLSLVASGGSVGSLTGGAGDWVRSGLDVKTWASDPNNPRGFTYENGTRNIEFLEWGNSVIRFRETRSDGTNLVFAYNGQNAFVEEQGQVS